MNDALLRRQEVEGALVLEPDELVSARRFDIRIRAELLLDAIPEAFARQPVLGVRLHGGCHVRGQRPRGRRPHHERFVIAASERKAHEERWMPELDVVLLPGLLVLRE
jgi:hypothetical protein